MALSHREEAAVLFLKEEKMITSVSNPQMKRIKELLNKSKQRRKEKFCGRGHPDGCRNSGGQTGEDLCI